MGVGRTGGDRTDRRRRAEWLSRSAIPAVTVRCCGLRIAIVLAIGLGLGPGSLIMASPAAANATPVRTFTEWTLYSAKGAQPICFLATSPAETKPAGVERQKALLYVSAWPRDGVRSEVSVKLGFNVKRGNEPILSVMPAGQSTTALATFKLIVNDDRAFVADATQELKLIDAMKKGSRLIVQATPDKGAAVTDTYSLAGITAGLQALTAGCP